MGSAIAALEHIRALNPFPAYEDGGPASLCAENKASITKGVVKIGFSWENRFVISFNNEKQLQKKLSEMLTQDGCDASHCVVQEWVNFDFEMRLYFLPPPEWARDAILEPARVECNAWGKRSDADGLGQSHASFWKMPKAACLEVWQGDEEAWRVACAQ